MREFVFFSILLVYSAALSFLTHCFPPLYHEEIERVAEEFDLDPALLAALVRVESSFNPSAVSPAGAVGLAQVMPHTADWIGEKLGVKGKLEDPMDNLRMGAAYLRYLLEKFKDLKKALKAYNVGPYALSSKDESAERYASKVLLAYRVYRLLYRWGG